MHTTKIVAITAGVCGVMLVYYYSYTLFRKKKSGKANSDQYKQTKGKKMKRVLKSYESTRMWIDGKTFEIPKLKAKSDRTITIKKGIEVNRANSSSIDGIELKYDIFKNEKGQLYTSFQLPFVYYDELRFSNFNIMELSESTKTSIFIPFKEQESQSQLIITGECEYSITRARDEIHSIIGEIRNKTPAQQFVCIPTTNEEIIRNFEKFKEKILKEDDIEGMHESIFQKPEKLHLTIFILLLLNEHEKKEACKSLNDFKTTFLDKFLQKSGPLKIHVKGLDCMNNNLKRVDVLYANARVVDDDTNILQEIADNLSEFFFEKGLLKNYQKSVKLHVTLINTRYRKSKKRYNQLRNKRQSFNATKIIEKYKNYDFGTCQFDTISLSLMSTVGDDGFYESISKIKFNE